MQEIALVIESQRESKGADGPIRLEASLRTPDGVGPHPAVVICHPHPQYGGSMFNDVVFAVASGLVARGVAALLFNFRGVGASGGSHGGGEGEQEDVRAALAAAAARPEIDAERVGLAGYSFGAAMAASTAAAASTASTGSAKAAPLPALALIALPLRMDGGPTFGLDGFASPLLFVSGDRDEGSSAEELRALAPSLGGRAEVQIVPGADHFWGGFEREIEDRVGLFFANALGDGSRR